MNQIPDAVIIAVATAVFVGGSVWGLAWWLSGQFTLLRNLVYEQIHRTETSIISKLEYHEKHDDTRFDDLKRDLWEIRVKQASNTANIRDLEKTIEK